MPCSVMLKDASVTTDFLREVTSVWTLILDWFLLARELLVFLRILKLQGISPNCKAIRSRSGISLLLVGFTVVTFVFCACVIAHVSFTLQTSGHSDVPSRTTNGCMHELAETQKFNTALDKHWTTWRHQENRPIQQSVRRKFVRGTWKLVPLT